MRGQVDADQGRRRGLGIGARVRYDQMYSSAIAPSRHLATVTIRPPPSNSPITHVHSPDPNAIGWATIWGGVPPAESTYAFMAWICSWIPRVGSWPFQSTYTSERC